MHGAVTLSDVQDMTEEERLLWLKRIGKQLRAELQAIRSGAKRRGSASATLEGEE